jgi:hypothetical protein
MTSARWAPDLAMDTATLPWTVYGLGLMGAATFAIGFKDPLAIAIPGGMPMAAVTVDGWIADFAALGVVAFCPALIADQAGLSDHHHHRGGAGRAEWLHRLARGCGCAWAPRVPGWDTDEDVARVLRAVVRRDRFIMMEAPQ